MLGLTCFLPIHYLYLPIPTCFWSVHSNLGNVLKGESLLCWLSTTNIKTMKLFISTSFAGSVCSTMLLLALSGCQNQIDAPQPVRQNASARVLTGQTAAQIVINSPVHTLLEAAVIRAGLADALSGGTLTLFAPTDDAFRRAGFADENAIRNASVQTLTRILLYHVIGGNSFESQFIPEAQVGFKTLQGDEFLITRAGGDVSVNGIRVTQADLIATNGVVHVIDRVLMPTMGNVVETALANPNLTYLVAAVVRATQGPVDVMRFLGTTPRLTVFAPTNQAFIDAGFPTIASIQAADPDVLTRILTYHVVAVPQFRQFFSANLVNGAVPTVQGGNVTIALGSGPAGVTVKGVGNSTPSNVVIPDVNTINGVVHVIDRVLLP
jgi:transforming growth factor-beta-induced protein